VLVGFIPNENLKQHPVFFILTSDMVRIKKKGVNDCISVRYWLVFNFMKGSHILAWNQ
jgi:hypothetical protein